MDLQTLLDREAIRACLARLARGEDRRDAALISASLWPDSVTDYGVFRERRLQPRISRPRARRIAVRSRGYAPFGRTFITAELAQAYGVMDVDGRTIPSLRERRGAPIWQPIRSTAKAPA